MMVLEIIGAAAAVITIFSAGVLQRLSFRKPESFFLAIKKTAHSLGNLCDLL